MTNSGTTDSTTHTTFCRLCEATCGIRVHTADDETGRRRAVRIEGDPEDAFSKGHICPKAHALIELQDDPDRLHTPMRRTEQGFVPIGWGEALDLAAEKLGAIDGVRLYGPAERAGAVSFAIEGVHHYDLGTLIDQMGVAVRTGHHCCQPLMARFGITGTTRASFACYNTAGEVDILAECVGKAAMMLR